MRGKRYFIIMSPMALRRWTRHLQRTGRLCGLSISYIVRWWRRMTSCDLYQRWLGAGTYRLTGAYGPSICGGMCCFVMIRLFRGEGGGGWWLPTWYIVSTGFSIRLPPAAGHGSFMGGSIRARRVAAW